MTSKDQKLNQFETIAITLFFTLVCISFVATLPQTLALLGGTRFRGQGLSATGGYGVRWLREAFSIFIPLFVFVWVLRFHPLKGLPRTAFYLLTVGIFWSVIVAWISFGIRDLKVLVILAGLRIFQYTPLIFLGFILTSNSQKIMFRMTDLLRWYVGLQTLVCAYQFFANVGVKWKVTAFGNRIFGTFPYYNHFGAAIDVCALYFLIADDLHHRAYGRSRYRLWLYLCIVLAFLSGSRAPMVTIVVIFLYTLYLKFKNPIERLTLSYLAPLVGMGVLYFVTNRTLTGRNVNLSSEGRYDIWAGIFDQFRSIWDYIFGIGLGLSTNTVVALYGKGGIEGQIGNAHNTFIAIFGNFGFVGLLIYFTAMMMTFRYGVRSYTLIFLFVVIALGIPYSIWEFFPTNSLLMFLWGCILGLGHLERNSVHKRTDPYPLKEA
jgi:hypothetical protein